MPVEVRTLDSSILTDIKKMLGLEEEYDAFDREITIYINSAFTMLNQLGVGPPEGFSITDAGDTWEDFLGERSGEMNAVRDYVYSHVRRMFDPPSNSFVMTALKDMNEELAWRLNVQAESGITE